MLFIRNVTFMSDDPRRLADFWSAVLGLSERRDEAAETICADADWSYPRLTFQKVTDSAARPRRLHLDLSADDRGVEVERVRSLGASVEREVVTADGWTWTVMSDPDGNEFCITDP